LSILSQGGDESEEEGAILLQEVVIGESGVALLVHNDDGLLQIVKDQLQVLLPPGGQTDLAHHIFIEHSLHPDEALVHQLDHNEHGSTHHFQVALLHGVILHAKLQAHSCHVQAEVESDHKFLIRNHDEVLVESCIDHMDQGEHELNHLLQSRVHVCFGVFKVKESHSAHEEVNDEGSSDAVELKAGLLIGLGNKT
jgi:hypothetical protein